MLPYWLRHHVPLFEYGVLIDHGSTDESAAICRELAPHWRYVQSRLDSFDAALNDAEVMRWEWDLAGFKIALNTSEFLAASPSRLQEIESQIGRRSGVWLQTKVMIDAAPGVMPDPSRPLLETKPHGLFQFELLARMGQGRDELSRHMRINRGRLYHQALCGCYMPGRHDTNLLDLGHCDPDGAYVCWYAFSPWCEPFVERKLAFRSRISEQDRQSGRGFQHLWGRAQLDVHHQRLSQWLHPQPPSPT